MQYLFDYAFAVKSLLQPSTDRCICTCVLRSKEIVKL